MAKTFRYDEDNYSGDRSFRTTKKRNKKATKFAKRQARRDLEIDNDNEETPARH